MSIEIGALKDLYYKKEIKMSFKKNGDAVPIESIRCSCGGEIDTEKKVCKSCGKEFLKEEVKK